MNIFFEEKKISLSSKVYFKGNRLYFPFYDFIHETGIVQKGNFNNAWLKPYISLIDCVKLFGLSCRFRYEDESIYLNYRNNTSERSLKHIENKTIYINEDNSSSKAPPAFIRFEDFTAGPPYNNEENLQRVRIIADYLYFNNIPFHVAWIPHYINPEENIDNDLIKNFNMANSDFLFTLDYMILKNGTIGIHGYTHQHGSETSGDGTEFNEKINNDGNSIRSKIVSSIKTAEALEIPIVFFESPHYASTEFQQSIIEQYFDYIYEPCVGIWGKRVVKSPRNNRTFYIPTPLSYVSGKYGKEKMLYRIKTLRKGIIGSLFYHLSRELKSNSFDVDNCEVSQIIKALCNKGYIFRKITEIDL